MSLSGSLSNALSGLTAASRAAQVVSSNVANAMTPGYARREINLSSQTVGAGGAGVKVEGVTRVVDEQTIADKRQAQASMSNASTRADAWLSIETAIGYPTESGSLTDRVNTLEATLVEAASRPDESVRLDRVFEAATSVVEGIHSVASEIQSMRIQADADIATTVDHLNAGLEQVQTLNWQIFKMSNDGQDVSSLMDQRQAIVDSISTMVPVHQVPRSGGQVALFTSGGATLIDGPAAEFAFEPAGMITADMTIENGALSGLTLNGHSLSIGGTYDPIAGGTLSAMFTVRDSIATEAQTSLDAFARDLIERFEDPLMDTSLSAGEAGLFVVGNDNAFDAAEEEGVANEIQINSRVDPSSADGALWRLRDGIGADTVGESGNSSLLSALAERLSEQSTPNSGPSSGLPRSVASHASDMLSSVALNYEVMEDSQAFHSARVDALEVKVMENGVDTDDEMQKLLLIEQAYAANARVVQTLDELMQQLLGI